MNTDFIEVYDNALSSENCKSIINSFDNDDKTLDSFDESTPLGKLSHIGYFFADQSGPYEPIIECVAKSTLKYRERHPQLDGISSWKICNGYNIQKYNPGDSYNKLHCENMMTDVKHMYRNLVWMVYLNTVTDGGGTYFHNYDRTTDAVEGRCVIWPAYWTHFHKGIVSNTQTKYIATGWFAHDPPKKPNSLQEDSVLKMLQSVQNPDQNLNRVIEKIKKDGLKSMDVKSTFNGD